MKLHKAEISDILRCGQRDEAFLQELQEYIVDTLKVVFGKRYNSFRKYIPICTSTWYYLLTSLSNLQTLGEEYTGIVRVRNEEIPSKFVQIVWLILYVGGDKLFDKFLVSFGKKVHFSNALTQEARMMILNIIEFIKENKHVFLRLHQSIFYMYGTYHNFSNRSVGIKYVLLRQWMQDSSATTSFNILGKLSIIYLIVFLIEKMRTLRISAPLSVDVKESSSSKMCVLCVDNCKNISTTPCGHLFCWECIYDALKHHPNCPVCREKINPSRIVMLQNYY